MGAPPPAVRPPAPPALADRARRAERGAMLVQVAVAILVLMGFLVFVVDSGVLWLARAQAQNAADAGALAGALARAYDEMVNPPAAIGPTYESARAAAESNLVWGEPGIAMVDYPCKETVAAGQLVSRCVRVRVYRNGEFGSTPLPTFFGPVLGLTSQGVRASATALVGVGNATDCMRPFAVADKWRVPEVPPLNQYDHWIEKGGVPVELVPSDLYVPPGPTPGVHTSYRSPNDVGLLLTLKGGQNPMSDTDPIVSSMMIPVRLPDGAGGYPASAAAYEDSIRSCVRARVTIGDYLPTHGGVMDGPTEAGVEELVAQDPKAKFNPVTKTVEGSCAPGCAPVSPRVVPFFVFDVEDFQRRRVFDDWSVCPSGGRCVKVVNVLGFFVVGMSGSDITGYLMTLPGEFSVGDPTVVESASFLKTVQLVR
jgi:hypothetical protein